MDEQEHPLVLLHGSHHQHGSVHLLRVSLGVVRDHVVLHPPVAVLACPPDGEFEHACQPGLAQRSVDGVVSDVGEHHCVGGAYAHRQNPVSLGNEAHFAEEVE